MDFKLTEEREAIAKWLRILRRKRLLRPWSEKETRKEIVKEMAPIRFRMYRSGPGGNESGVLAATVMTEEVANFSILAPPFNLQMNSIRHCCSILEPRNNERVSPKLINQSGLGCFPLPRQTPGQTSFPMKTAAGSNCILNGTKMWISGRPVARCGMVSAYQEPLQRSIRRLGAGHACPPV